MNEILIANVLATMRVRLTGVTPLLMHSCQGVDPNNPLVMEKQALTDKKKNKTKADQERIDELDWLLGLYLDEDGIIIVPGTNLEGMLEACARKRRKGPLFLAGVRCGTSWPLIYDGPKNLAKLYADPNFKRRASVVIGKNRIMRVWPRFLPWGVEFEITYRIDILAKDDIVQALDTGAKEIGFMDYRPKFGVFTWKEI